MKTAKLLLAVSAAVAMASPAMAQDADMGWYGALGFEYLDLGQRDDPTRPFNDGSGNPSVDNNGDIIFAQESVDTINVFARVGYDINRFFALEAEGKIGVVESGAVQDTTVEVPTFDTRVKWGVGGFAVGKLPLNDQFDAFGRVGYHNTKVGFESTAERSATFDNEFNIDVDGYALGGGIQYTFGELLNTRIRLEYTYYDGSSNVGGQDSFALSYVRRF